tara:strand:+ start:333 stop:635 length:303 start_codon:yes stop_codon:yes gene_type:complete
MKLLYVEKSRAKGKKFKATFESDEGLRKTTHFGSSEHSDYTGAGGTKEPTSDEQKRLYKKRHAKDNLDDPLSAGALSMFLLWHTRDLNKNIQLYRKRFNV